MIKRFKKRWVKIIYLKKKKWKYGNLYTHRGIKLITSNFTLKTDGKRNNGGYIFNSFSHKTRDRRGDRGGFHLKTILLKDRTISNVVNIR